ncbi:MAG: peptidoglycan DD-metalloendopeptidase family protein [Flavobacterium sp.]
MKKRNLTYMLGAAGVLLLAISCPACTSIATGITNGFTKVADVITNPTARQQYAREFKDNNEAFIGWEADYDAAVKDSLRVSLPYGEKGSFTPNANGVYSYVFNLKEGEVLAAEVIKDSATRIFMDVFEQDGSGYRHLESTDIDETSAEFVPGASGTYKILIQPEMAASGPFFISLDKKPLYKFPVAGKGNAAVGSFWGMERDGGARKHEGIDIFAKKGTPVVAITDGSVSYTGERGIGGKQVWLRDGLFGKSLYYAHLDGIAVETGQNVKAGDTLGFVGNTGNARFTPAHLHFGIYRFGGAVDPLPYVFATAKISAKSYPVTFKSTELKVKGKGNLRQGPATTNKVIGAVTANETVKVLGQHKDWLHVRTADNQRAYLHKSLVKI